MAGGKSRIIGILALIGFTLTGTSRADEPPLIAPINWRPTFSEPFDTLNLLRWSTVFPWRKRWIGVAEKQVYVDPSYTGNTSYPLGLNPFLIHNGILTIRADRASAQLAAHLGGQLYTSGLLTTYSSFSQLYGYFEMRARLPYGKGLWPTFWLLPADRSWPPEVDIAEVLGHQPTILHVTLHYAGNADYGTSFPVAVPDLSEAFHVFGLLWTAQYIAWYFDNARVAYTPTTPDMHKPMYMLLNLAVGGDWPGQPDATTKFPADMQVDFVRAYALPQTGRD